MADDELFFRGTCTLFELKTCIEAGVLNSEQFIDPCSCYSYYQCSNNYKMIHQTCAEGTAWDFETKGCRHNKEVIFNQNCKATNVWTRCNVTESRLDELKYLCTNETNTTAPTTSTTQPTTISEELTSDKINPGIIIGSIIGGAIIAVIVLVLAFCLYRRKKKNSINKNRSTTIAHNPEYFEGGQPDDPYAVINDDHVIQDNPMSNPTYNGTLGGTMSQLNGTFTNDGFDGSEGDAVYDNSGAPIVGPGYTSTIRRSIREYETPTREREDRENLHSGESGGNMATGQTDNVESAPKGGNLLDVNGNKNKSSVNSGYESETPSSDLASGSRDTENSTNDNSPDYFILEQTDDNM